MIVIAKDTEEKLLNDLRECRRESIVSRCYYMAFSKIDIPKNELFENFLRLLHEIPDSYRAQVYICQDRDVFILMQGFMQRQFTDFLQDLSRDLGRDDLSSVCEVLEVAAHWIKLETICQRKIEKIQKQNQKEIEERRKAAAENVTLEALESLDPVMVTSVIQRRRERLNPVVMIADDDQIARTLVGNVVRENYDWAYAKDGQGALKEYVSTAPDVLFLDIGLPDINGHDVLEALFQIDPDAYIIMFSGRKDKQNIMKALEAGAQGFVAKPFTREKLYQYITRSPHLAGKLVQEDSHATASQ